MSSSVAIQAIPASAISVERTTCELSEDRFPVTESDEAVMQRVQSGDKQALGILFDRYARLVRSVALRILRDFSEAEELTQDVFVYIYRKCQMYDSAKGALRPWLVQIAYCRAFNRRNYLITRRFYDYCNIDEIVESLQSNVSLENEVQTAEWNEALRGALSELSPAQQRTLMLFFFEGYTLREISAHLNETLASVRSHYYRGLAKLKSAVKPGSALAAIGWSAE